MATTSRTSIGLATLLLAFVVTHASAQSWSGYYIAGSIGSGNPATNSEQLEFDSNLDGEFGDTVTMIDGTNYFSPGFCKGAATGQTPASGCRTEKSKASGGLRGGYDWQTDKFVYGIVGDILELKFEDSVSGFSTAPDFYRFSRKLDTLYALRGRVGYTDDAWLFYGTAGLAWSKINRTFATSNGLNAFAASDGKNGTGYQVGLGVEKKIHRNLSLGVEYLHTSLDDKGAVVRASASSQTFASNPFLITNAAGSDIRRGDDRLKIDSLSLTLTYHFGTNLF